MYPSVNFNNYRLTLNLFPFVAALSPSPYRFKHRDNFASSSNKGIPREIHGQRSPVGYSPQSQI